MKHGLFISSFFLSVILYAQGPQAGRPSEANVQVEDQSEIKIGENTDEKIKRNFFLRADVTKTNCYVGEPIMATYKAFSRLTANSRVVRRPALTGFSVLEMVDAYNNEPEVEMVNGQAFNSHLIRKVQLFPLQEGTFSLEPAEVESQIFLRNPDMVKSLSLETPPITVTVKPLPLANQPDSFSGAVGNFSVELQMKERDLNRFDPATVRLIVSGTGNFPLITDPDIAWPRGVEVSPPQVTENVNKYVYPLSGAKIFQYHLDVHGPGAFTIQPVSFSFFDPVSGKYRTIKTGEVSFNVKKGRKRINLIGTIINNPKEVPIQYYYFGIVVIAIVGWIVLQLVRSRRKK